MKTFDKIFPWLLYAFVLLAFTFAASATINAIQRYNSRNVQINKEALTCIETGSTPSECLIKAEVKVKANNP